MDSKFSKIVIPLLLSFVSAFLIYSFRDSDLVSSYGYLGVFFLSLISSATIFVPLPGWASVIALSQTLDPLFLGISAGLGSAIGELTGFYAGRGIGEIAFSKNKKFLSIRKGVSKHGGLFIFLFSFIPNPFFDMAGAAAGSLGMGVFEFLLFCFLGKTFRFFLLATVSSAALSLF